MLFFLIKVNTTCKNIGSDKLIQKLLFEIVGFENMKFLKNIIEEMKFQ